MQAMLQSILTLVIISKQNECVYEVESSHYLNNFSHIFRILSSFLIKTYTFVMTLIIHCTLIDKFPDFHLS